jgi:hypothetical protein
VIDDRRRAVSFAAIFAATAGILLALTAAVNFIVNPYGVYRSRRFAPYSWNVRQAKATHLAAAPVPNILLLGSSRSFALDPAYVEARTGLSAYNASVTSGRLIDYAALLRLVFAQPTASNLKTVFIGLDLGSFWSDISVPLELRSTPTLFRYVEPGSPAWMSPDAFRLISFGQLSDSVQSIRQARSGRAPNLSVDDNGLVHFAERERRMAEGAYDLAAAIREELPYLEENYSKRWPVSPAHTHWLEQIALACRDHGVRLVVYLAPDHPSAVERLQQFGWAANHARVLSLIQAERAQSAPFDIVDLSTIDTFGGAPEAFVNATHVTDVNARRMLDVLLRGTGRAVQ